MKKLLLVIIAFVLPEILFATPITENYASEIAKKFLQQNSQIKDTSQIHLVFKADANNINMASNLDIAYYYVFNGGDNSFVIVAGDDASIPILGYSFENNFNQNSIPENTLNWLNEYQLEVNYIIANKIPQTAQIKKNWADINNKKDNRNKIQSGVTSLIKTKWNQKPYYNDLCPYDETYKTHTLTGCVATAMAQIMRYWSYPAMGSGFHSYTHPLYGTLSANFAATYYNWGDMPLEVKSSNNSVAVLMYNCGVSVDMNYGVSASGAGGTYLVAPALTNYFRYDKALSIAIRSSYSYNDWVNLLKGELLMGRPIYYQGFSNGSGGHAFVCDGFNDDNYFHFNWGWGGMADGYFLIDVLNPVGTTFNRGQSAVIGIQPPTDQMRLNLELENEIKINNPLISYGSNFSISADIVNNSSSDFSGDICAAILDESNNFIDYVDVLSNISLKQGVEDTISFLTGGIVKMTPGKYKVYILFRETNGQWKQVRKGSSASFSDVLNIEVFNNSELSLYSPINILPLDTLVQGDSMYVNFNVINNSNTNTFKGKIILKLINKENSQITKTLGTYDEVAGLLPKSYYPNNLMFKTDSIDIPYGNYFVAVFYQEDSSDKNLLINSNNEEQNPKQIVILPKPLPPDKYEPNNTVLSATHLQMNFIDNKCSVFTDSANINKPTDVDIYQIKLEVGYNYRININFEDAEDFQETNNFTLKGSLLYSFDGTTWSDNYSNIAQRVIETSGNKTIYFKVIPYFDGLMGTYRLDLNITRNEDSIPIMLVEGDLNFNKVAIDTFAIKTLKVQNQGAFVMNVTDIFCPDGFTVAPVSFTLEPNQDTIINVKFTPTEADDYYGSVIIFSNARDSHTTIEVSGTGFNKSSNTAIVGIEGTLDFGNVGLGRGKLLTMTISNSGNSNLDVASISYPAGFSGNWKGGTIGPNQNQNIIVEFAPTKLITYTGSIIVNCNFTDGVNNISVSGKGVDPNSIEEHKSNNSTINLYPNPVSNRLNVFNLPETACSYAIYNSFGIKVSEGVVSNQIDVSNLAAGLYFLKLNSQAIPMKFIKL